MRRSPRRSAAAFVLAAFAFGLLTPAAGAAANDRAVVRRRRVVIVRTGELARRAPAGKRAVVTYPVVSGLSNPKVLRKVRQALSLESVFNTSLAELRRSDWLEELYFKVNYNKNYVLDITFWISTYGAYPETNQAHLAISLKTGDVLKARDVFEAGALDALARMANEKLKAEVAEQVTFVEQDRELSGDQEIKEMLSGLAFGVEHLDNFMVGETGVTFIYEANFRHAIRALEPAGQYFFTYAQLAPYVRRDGPLGRFVK